MVDRFHDKLDLRGPVDLDDLETYPDEWRQLRFYPLFTKCEIEAGRSLFYMRFLHNNIDWEPQAGRVWLLCQELADIWCDSRKVFVSGQKSYPEHELLLMKWLYRFNNEVENQC